MSTGARRRGRNTAASPELAALPEKDRANQPAATTAVGDTVAVPAPGPALAPLPSPAAAGSTTATPSVGSLLPLYTPAAAAELLAMRESWLRRRATARTVPCTFLGKHLRFSHADVVAIAAAGAHPVGAPAGRRLGATGSPGRAGRR